MSDSGLPPGGISSARVRLRASHCIVIYLPHPKLQAAVKAQEHILCPQWLLYQKLPVLGLFLMTLTSTDRH